ncbi:Phage-related protein [Ensifer adhaerens]|nr:Phage-related protein [Ensifer adhaerens]
MNWTVEFYDEDVRDDLETLPKDMIAHFIRISELIADKGLDQVREPYVKHLEGPLWKMRLKGRDGIARAAYVTRHARRVVVVHVFRKKVQKTPRRDIELALKRARTIL